LDVSAKPAEASTGTELSTPKAGAAPAKNTLSQMGQTADRRTRHLAWIEIISRSHPHDDAGGRDRPPARLSSPPKRRREGDGTGERRHRDRRRLVVHVANRLVDPDDTGVTVDRVRDEVELDRRDLGHPVVRIDLAQRRLRQGEL